MGTVYSGAVYTYSRSGTVWSEKTYLKDLNTGYEDFFGHSISLSGDGEILASGATKEDGDGIGIGSAQNLQTNHDSGAVYVY
ncbi:MAG: hypothetical protein K6L75_03955 [Cellvibrionaceae bacterium]